MKIEVKAEHIAHGMPYSYEYDPIARAIRVATKLAYVYVDTDHVLAGARKAEAQRFTLPDEVIAWIKLYDANDPPGSRAQCEPFSFELPLEPLIPPPSTGVERAAMAKKKGQVDLFS